MDPTARQIVLKTIREILADRGRLADEPADQAGLFADGLGLDSLDFATVVVRLEQETGRDPFRSGQVDRLPRTVGELVSIYSRQPGG